MTEIPDEAVRLHDEGRAAGSGGDPARALELFMQAHRLAPDWPYPYDMAFTYLLEDYLDEAEKWYAVVDELAPKGFFTCKTSLDIIRREKRGELPDGFAKAVTLLEWEAADGRRHVLEQLTQKYPTLGAAWAKLAATLDDDAPRLAAIDHGLACDTDDDTYSMLVLNKALILNNRGDSAQAKQLLDGLLQGGRCTVGAEPFARGVLGKNPD